MVVILDGERVLKVDSHTHILPNGWPDEFDIPLRLVKYDEVTAKGFAARLEYKATGKLFRELKPNCFDAEIVLKQCDSCGVDVQVCCTVPVMFNYNLPSDQMAKWAQFLNDDLARVVNTRPDRLAGLGTLPLQDTAASVAEVARCVKMGIKGFQIGSHVNAFRGYEEDGVTPIVENLPLNHADLRPVFAECARLGACLMVHPWDMEWWCVSEYWQPWLVGMPSETTLAGTALILGGVMSQFPTLRVMMSHGGGSLAWLRGRIDWGYKCRPDLVAKDCPDLPSTLIKRLYFDSITHDEVCLQEVVRYVGPEKVMLGSDYPFPLGEVPSIAPSTEEHLKAYPGQLIQDTGLLTHEQKKKLLALSCMEWLGMDPQMYSHRLLDHTICAQLACPPPPPTVSGAGEAEGPNGESKKEEYDYVPALEYFPVAEEDRSQRYAANPLAGVGHERDVAWSVGAEIRSKFPRGDVIAAAGHCQARPASSGAAVAKAVLQAVNTDLGSDNSSSSSSGGGRVNAVREKEARGTLSRLLGCSESDITLGGGRGVAAVAGLMEAHLHPQIFGQRRKILCLASASTSASTSNDNNNMNNVRSFLVKSIVNTLAAVRPVFEAGSAGAVGSAFASLEGSDFAQEFQRLSSIFLLPDASEAGMMAELDATFLAVLTPDAHSGLYDTAAVIREIESVSADLCGAVLPSVVPHTSQLLDMKAINNAFVDKAGVLCVWDLSHSAGAILHALEKDGVVAATACGHRLLNGVPGGPGFTYQNSALLGKLTSGAATATTTSGALIQSTPSSGGTTGGDINPPEALALGVLMANLQVVQETGEEAWAKLMIALGDSLVSSLDHFFDADIKNDTFRYLSPRESARRGATVCVSLADVDPAALKRALWSDKYNFGMKFDIDAEAAASVCDTSGDISSGSGSSGSSSSSSSKKQHCAVVRLTAHCAHTSFKDTVNLACCLHAAYRGEIQAAAAGQQ